MRAALGFWNKQLLFDLGGAQAVAAMAYGTESVPKVDKLCGPGNAFVTMAKMLVQNDSTASVSIDMPAGPSEVMVCKYSNITQHYRSALCAKGYSNIVLCTHCMPMVLDDLVLAYSNRHARPLYLL